MVYVRELLEIEAVKLCARNRTVEDLAVIEAALKECEEKFYTDERVSKDFAYHQALARGAHNPVIASLLLVITPDVLRYYQRYPGLLGAFRGGLLRTSGVASLCA